MHRQGTGRTARFATYPANVLAVTLLLTALGAPGSPAAGPQVLGIGGVSRAFAAETAVPERVSSLDEYRDRILKAQAVVRNGFRAAVGSASAAEEIAFEVDELLPAIEVVFVGDRRITVDNSVLRSLVERVRSAPTPDGREQALSQMNDHLASLLVAVGDGQPAAVRQDRAALDRILSGQAMNQDPAVLRRFAEMLDRVIQWVGERWGAVTATPGGQVLAEVLKWAVALILVALLLLVLWQVVRRIRAALASSDPKAAVPGSSADAATVKDPLPADALAYADGLASKGLFREGVRALMRGSVRALRHEGLLHRTRARTTSELLGQLATADAGVLGPMRGLSARFDRAWYGQADPGDSGFREARQDYQALTTALAQAESADEQGLGDPDAGDTPSAPAAPGGSR